MIHRQLPHERPPIAQKCGCESFAALIPYEARDIVEVNQLTHRFLRRSKSLHKLNFGRDVVQVWLLFFNYSTA